MQESAKESRNYKVPEFTGNPNQEQAIMHTAGAAQVFAGPGSGKTYVIVHRIRQLITGQGIDPSHILVITFTKAAALEMQERFFRLMEPERPTVRFGTFHAVFYHILKQSAQYRDYVIITETERRKLIRQIIHMHKRFACLQEEDMDSIIASLSAYKTSSVIKPLPVQKIGEEDILFLAEEYASYLREFKQMDFDDILCHCYDLLTAQSDMLIRWQKQFSYILIDEFQDISPKQYEIVRLLAAPEDNLFIVGDDDQSIYGFRGASPGIMRDFMRDYPSADRFFLDINYRCNSQIVEAAGRVIGENHNRVEKQVRAAHEEGAGLYLQIFRSATEEEEWLSEELARKKELELLEACAMICRTNYDCAMWAQTLRRKGIPFTMKEAPKSRFRHFVIQDIMAYMALAQGRGELVRKHFLRIMNRPVRYLKREAVSQERIVEAQLTAYYRDTPVLQERIRKLFHDLESLRTKSPHLQVHYIRKIIGYDRYLTEKYGVEKSKELIDIGIEFQEFAKEFQTLAQIDDYISQYEETLRNIRTCETEAAGIRLMTMHASKGLEFDTVYIPDCQEGTIPSARSQTDEEIEEERRMFYVAMTRARRELYLMAYQGKSGKDVPSRFIKCLCQSSSSTNSSNSAESRYSSNASVTASYSSSSSI
ncbi:MAG: ATP-dependent helicase [Lachnospiraceae bacterium]|nr:ATP-dependent helicase [Lachnospiraceae bacterium]